MADPRHASPEADGFLLSLARHVGAAVALVLVVAGAFWAIGQIDGDTDGVVVADGPTEGSPDPTAPPTAPPTDGATSPTVAPTETATDGATPTETDTGTETATPTTSPSTPAADETVPPGDVSIQVLDAVRMEGSTAARDLADRLETDGYDVVVVNPASKVYDVTTVFYSPGHEAAARQIAAAYGFGVVEEKPSNLSDSVRIHLVVGRDRA